MSVDRWSHGRLSAVLIATALVAVSCGSDDKVSPRLRPTPAVRPHRGHVGAGRHHGDSRHDRTVGHDGSVDGRHNRAGPAATKVTDFAGTSADRAKPTRACADQDRVLQPARWRDRVSDTNINGVNAAVKFINEEAGGIGGHPLEVVTCYIANTEEEGQQCGQQFANDDSIVAIETGPTVHRHRVVLRRPGRLEASGRRRVGECCRHRAGRRCRPVRRRQVHPGAVRDVRPRHAEGRSRRRWSIRRAPDRTKAPRARRPRSRLPASRSRWCSYPADTPDLTVPLHRRRRPGRRSRDAGHQPQ